MKQYENTQSLKRKQRLNTKLKISFPIVKYVEKLVKKEPTITLWDTASRVKDKFNVELSDRSITQIFKEINFTRKRVRKKYYPAKKIETEEKDLKLSFYKTLQSYDYKKTISIDETAIKLSMELSYGRSKSGTRVIKKTTQYPFEKYNLLCAISHNKIVGWKLFPQKNVGVKSDDVIEFYKEHIDKKYKKHLIVMDNAVIHRTNKLKAVIKESKNTLLYSFPYHPETNAIEEFFSQLKHYIKKESPKTYDELYVCIEEIMKTKIKKVHLKNYLYHSFYQN